MKRPSLEEVEGYFRVKQIINPEDAAEHFIDYYDSCGWKVGKKSMVDWKAAVRNWIRQSKRYGKSTNKSDGLRNTDLYRNI